MSKTETQSEALTAERRLFITAVANLELRKKFGDEGFRLDLERDELEALIEMLEMVSRLDAENKALRAQLEAPAVDAETAKDAACWRMLPAFFADYQIESMKLYRDMDALLAAQAAAKNGDAA